jgi:hypothetical protein
MRNVPVIDVGQIAHICAMPIARIPILCCAGSMGAVMERDSDRARERISIERCREILGNEADDLSDADVEQICRHAEVLAHVVVKMFIDQRSARE